MSVSRELSRTVRSRAVERCQYCQMHECFQGATFHVEHVVPNHMGGLSELDNLVLACPGCNLRKAGRVFAIDPVTGNDAQLFHPVRQIWSEHFRFRGHQIEGLTAVGRATIEALGLNPA
jgi:hypothetical protein